MNAPELTLACRELTRVLRGVKLADLTVDDKVQLRELLVALHRFEAKLELPE